VERINIVGNVRTLDEVIRREFRIVEGDAFNSAKIRRSQQGIRNLGFFEKVEIDTTQGSGPDRSVLTVEVAEQSTGELSFGAGLSSIDGPLGDIGITERNLMGRGQSLRLGLTISARRQEIDLSFTEPYFLKKDVSAGFDVFRRNVDLQDESSFDQDTLGFRLRTGYPITERLRHNLNYELSRDDISDVDEDASRFIKEQEGETLTSSVGQSFTYDVRDSRIETTEGYILRIGQKVAGLGVRDAPAGWSRWISISTPEMSSAAPSRPMNKVSGTGKRPPSQASGTERANMGEMRPHGMSPARL